MKSPANGVLTVAMERRGREREGREREGGRERGGRRYSRCPKSITSAVNLSLANLHNIIVSYYYTNTY